MFLIELVVLLLGALYLGRPLRKLIKYIGLLFVSVSLISLFYTNSFINLFVSGELWLAFFVVVMFAGAFPKASKASKKLR